jgi:hypothetical protein
VSVLITIAFIAVVAMGGLAVYSRLVRLRTQVTRTWKLLEADQSKTAAQNVYNAHVASYNSALETFPAYLIAPVMGFKPARRFEPHQNSDSRNPGSEI